MQLKSSLRRQSEHSALLATNLGNSNEPRATKMWAEPGAPLGMAHATPCQPPTGDRPGRETHRVPATRPGEQKVRAETSEERELEREPGPHPTAKGVEVGAAGALMAHIYLWPLPDVV